MLRGLGFTHAIGLFALALGITPAATARGDSSAWSAPQVLGAANYFGPDRGTGGPQLVSDESGDRAVAWTSPGGLRVALAHRGGPFGPSRVIASSVDEGPIVAIDERGDVAVAWDFNDHSHAIPADMEVLYCCDHVGAATLAAGARRFRYQDLATPRRSLHVRSLAIAANGSTVAVSYESEPLAALGTDQRPHELFARVGRFGHLLGRGVALGAELDVFSMRASPGQASLLMGITGREDADLREAVVTEPGRRTAHRRIRGLAGFRSSVQPEGYDAQGEFALLAEVNIPGGIAYDFAIRHASGPFRVQRLATTLTSEEREPIRSPAMAVSATGTVLATWTGPGIPSLLTVASGQLHSGRLKRWATLNPVFPGPGYDESADAINPRGQGVIVADQDDPTARFQEGGPLLALFRSPSGRLSPPVLIGRIEDVAYNELTPAVVIDAQGRGVAVWQNGRYELIARRFRSP